MRKDAKADVTPVRQRTQFTCMSTSMMMCLQANGIDCTEDEVNRVMGAKPMKGARWEEALACAQHYGMRATLTVPATVNQLKEWTDRGVPVMIAWNPEGRDWSHASVVFDVDENRNVHIADPNIPNPEETERIVPENEFYSKWFEKWPDYLVRRPALAVESEITPDGKQVMAMANSTGKKAAKHPGTTDPVDNKPIYPNPIDHGYDQPLAGGTDVMKRLQDELLHEQGRPKREKNPKIAYWRDLPAFLNQVNWASPAFGLELSPAVERFKSKQGKMVGGNKKVFETNVSAVLTHGRQKIELSPIGRLSFEVDMSPLGEWGSPHWITILDMKHPDLWAGREMDAAMEVKLDLKASSFIGHKLPGPPKDYTFRTTIGDLVFDKRLVKMFSRAEQSAAPRVAFDGQNRELYPQTPTPPEGLIAPFRRPGAIDPAAPNSFWFVDKDAAVVWRNYHFPNRFVMGSPNGAAFYVLVPSDKVGQWGLEGWQMVAQPNNPRTALEELEEMDRLAKFPKGKKMTIDEVAEVVGPEFKEQHEMHKDTIKDLHKKEALEELARLAKSGMPGSGDELEARFEKGKPADPTKNMSPAEKAEWEAQNKKHRDKFKKKEACECGGTCPGCSLERLAKVPLGDAMNTFVNNAVTVMTRKVKDKGGTGDELEARFEKGKPADPTKNMSPAEKAEWEAQNKKHRDKFKKKEACFCSGDDSPCTCEMAQLERLASRTLRDNEGRVWGPKPGLEGPIPFRGGRVLYYDPRERGGTYYDPTTDLYLSDAEADRLSRTAEDKAARKLKRIWMVSNPTKSDEFVDIITRDDQILDRGTAVHDDPKSAEADALSRLEEFWGGEIPDWVFEHAGPGSFRRAKELRYVWMVRDPSDISEMGDILYRTTPQDLAALAVGTGVQRWRQENTTLHDDAKSAEKDARDRLSRLWKGEIPAWVKAGPRRARLTWEKEAAGLTLWAAVYGDGVVVGATDDPEGANPGYWRQAASRDNFAVYKLTDVPLPIAEKLVDHGTRAQRFDDRKAFAFVKKFAQGNLLPSHRASGLVALWGDPIERPEPVEGKTAGRAPSGLYGYTKRIQRDVEASIRKLQRKAKAIAKAAYKKDENVAPFLAFHAKRGKSTSAKILVAALKGLGPKVASVVKEADDVADVLYMHDDICLDDERDRAELVRDLSEVTGAPPRKIEQKFRGRDECLEDPRIRETIRQWMMRVGSEDGDKQASYGIYGFRSKTATLGLNACTTLKGQAGSIASDLHRRQTDRHAHITGFLKEHTKAARCNYARILNASYPDAEMRLASKRQPEPPLTVSEWLSWEG